MPGESFPQLVELMRRLRAPGGCPWDREQTFQTIKPYLLEETYEVVEAIDTEDFASLKDELGDLLLQVVFFSQMAAEAGHFTVDQVVEAIHTKLVRRHPHVFGDASLDTPDQVKKKWSELKEEERRKAAETAGQTYQPRKSILDGVSKAQPALMEAFQLTDRAAFVGFDWPNVDGIVDKMEEELEELKEAKAVARVQGPGASKEIEDEVGDLLFTAVNLARGFKLEPETVLRKANKKFRARFAWMENKLAEAGKKPSEASLDEMEALWQQSKRSSL